MVECVRILQGWEEYACAMLLSMAGITLAVLSSLHPDAFYNVVFTLVWLTPIAYFLSHKLFTSMRSRERLLFSGTASLGLLPIVHVFL